MAVKVVGKFIGGYQERAIAEGGYVAFDAQCVHVRTRTDKPVDLDKDCYISVETSYLLAHIKKSNGDYMEPDIANQLVKEIATKKVVDLDKYEMAFYVVLDMRPSEEEYDDESEE